MNDDQEPRPDDADREARVWGDESRIGSSDQELRDPYEAGEVMSALRRIEPLIETVQHQISTLQASRDQKAEKSPVVGGARSANSAPGFRLWILLVGLGVGAFVSAASFVLRLGTVSPDGVPTFTFVNVLFGLSATLLTLGYYASKSSKGTKDPSKVRRRSKKS